MPEHYTKDTTGVMRFCNTCNRMTLHTVFGKRLGHCVENHVKDVEKRVYYPEDKQGSLF
jgi:hypothetical protein